MGKRNITEEIQNLKSRKEFDTYWEIDHKLDKIHTCIEDLQKSTAKEKAELLKYIPVALVATMESFIRSTIAKLINHDPEYLTNAKGLHEGKFEFEVFTKLHKREFTIGEFMSHQLKLNKFENITDYFETILQNDFINKLKIFNVSTFYSGFHGPHPKYFAPNYENIVKDVKRVLELRHIICHEMSSKLVISNEEILSIYKSVRALVYQIYNYTYTLLFPDSTLDTPELLKKSQQKNEDSRAKLNSLLEKIRAEPLTSYEARLDIKAFNEAHEHWEKYIEKYAHSLYAVFGNEVYQSLVLDEMTDLITERIENLEAEFLLDQ